MTGARVDAVRGIRPRVNPRLLPEGEGQTAENTRLGSGSLEPWNDLEPTAEFVDNATEAIHLFRNDGAPLWLTSENDVDYARGPVPNDDLERTYYTGEAEPRMTYTTIAASDYRLLGIPAPTGAPTVVGEDLPEEAITGTMTLGSMDTNVLKADFCIEDNLPANLNGWFMGEDSGYDAVGTVRVFNMDFFIGQQIRVASVTDTNTVTLEDANGGTYLAKTTQQARASGGGITQFRTDDTGTSSDGHFRFYVPNGVEVTLPTHGLQVGDVIRITSLPSTLALKLTQVATGTATIAVLFGAESDNGAGTAGSNTWPAAPVSVAADDFWIEGLRAYPFVDVWSDADGAPGTDLFTIEGGFAWELAERDGVSYDSIATDIESRVYVYTFVSELGEEGPPSPASDIVTIPTAGDVLVGGFDTPPSTKRNITHMRIYRATTGSDQTVFQFVAEIADPFDDYNDTILDIDLGELLQTESWEPPPEDMIGIKALPNGGMAGFFGKTVCLAEPYFPHAWPPEYQIAVDHDVVGLGIVPNGVAILTKGPVYIAAGDHPRAMSLRHFTDSQSCLSKRSIANTMDGVLYSAPDGLAFVGSSGFKLVTEDYVAKREWQASFAPTSIKGFWHDQKYFGFQTTGGFVFDPNDPSIGLSTIDVTVTGGFLDSENDVLYVFGGDSNDGAETRLVAVAQSGTNRVMYSDDGITWAAAAAASASIWQAVAYGADLFVAVGNNVVMTSPDGITWTTRTAPTEIWRAVTYSLALNLFVAAGGSGSSVIMTSPDGITWTSRTVPAVSTLQGVMWNDRLGLFVAGGSTDVVTSPDGITWTQRTTAQSTGAGGDNGSIVMLMHPDGDIISYSADAITWLTTDVGANTNCLGATFGAGLFVLTFSSGAANRVWTSPDAITWTGRTAPAQSWSEVVYSPVLELFVAVATTGTGNRVMTSPDGITWTSRTTPEDNTWNGVGVREPLSLISEWDAAATQLTATWKSGRVVCPHPMNPSAARVLAEEYPVTFILYNDQGDLVTTRTVTTPEVFRLPGGYLTDWFEVEVQTDTEVTSIQIAETVGELLAG
jgi:hypothetical protein